VSGVLLTGSASNRLHAVDQETGSPRWSVGVTDQPDGTIVYAPVSDGDVAVAGFIEFTASQTGGLVAVDLKTGALRWKRRFPAPEKPALPTNSAGGPVLYEQVVIAASGDGSIHAFDRTSGELRWSIPRLTGVPGDNPISPDRDYRALAISGSTLVAGSLTGIVAGYDLATREERWRFYARFAGSTAFRVAADDELFYVPHVGGELIAIDATSGTERWRIGDWKAGFSWAPLVWKDRLFACATGEGLYAFRRGGSVRPPDVGLLYSRSLSASR
jgi:hypothetical protein